MAKLESIAKAKAMSLGLKNFFGVEPMLEFNPDHVRVYYTRNQLIIAKRNFNRMMDTESDVKLELAPVMAPYFIKKYAVFVGGAALALYLMGKL